MSLKRYMTEKELAKQKSSDKEIFNKLGLNEKEVFALKASSLSSEISVTSLINLVLREKLGNIIKEENREELLLRGYINESDTITDKGLSFINEDSTVERLRKLSES